MSIVQWDNSGNTEEGGCQGASGRVEDPGAGMLNSSGNRPESLSFVTFGIFSTKRDMAVVVYQCHFLHLLPTLLCNFFARVFA